MRSLAGGLAAWVAGGHPTAQGVNTPSKVFGELILHDLRTPEITPLELSRRMAAGDDMVIVDTRTPEEYARGCLPGAWSMPGGELVLRLGELVLLVDLGPAGGREDAGSHDRKEHLAPLQGVRASHLIGCPTLKPHDLRHGVAMEVLEQHHDLEEVRTLLGHARIDTTQIYASIRPLQLKRAVAFYEKKAMEMLSE